MSAQNSMIPVIAAFLSLLGAVALLEGAAQSLEAPSHRVVIGMPADTGTPLLDARSPVHDEQHQAARQLVYGGRVDEAIDELQQVADANRTDPRVWAELGQLMLVARRDGPAANALEKSRSLDGSDPWVALHAGLAYLRMDRPRLAEERLREALTLRPNFHDATVALGRLMRQERRFDEAVEWLEPVSTRGSNERRSRALAELGRVYLELDEPSRAEVAFERAIERAPASIRVRLNIAHGLAQEGSVAYLQRAVRALEQALLISPEHAPLYNALGRVQERLGERVLARSSYELALSLAPSYILCRRRLVRLLSETGDHDAALQHVETLLSNDPDASEAHFLAGFVADAAGRPEDALTHYQTAIEEAGGHYPEAHVNLAAIHRRRGNPDAAIRLLEQALQDRPGYLAARNNLALAWADAGQLARGTELPQRVVAEEQAYATGWFNLGRLLARQDQHEAAVKAFRRAVDEEPTYWTAWLSLGAAQRRSGSPEAAVATYDEVIKLGPALPAAWYNRGVALQELKRVDAAIDAYEAALRLDSGHTRSMSRLSGLYLDAGRPARALQWLDGLLAANQEDRRARRRRAQAHGMLGNGLACRADVAVLELVDPSTLSTELCGGEG